MGLINLLTDPKNFKFYNGGQGYTGNGNQPGLTNIPYGKDRIDGGSSGQPYIQIPIPDNINNLGAANKDFVLRGGTLAVQNSVTDALRLTKMFGDLKSPSGLLFVAKQQLLSRTAVRTQASGKELNEGIYNPLSTIAQAGGVAFGTHLNKQFNVIPYSDVVKNNQQPEDNRLYSLYHEKINNKKGSLPGIKGFATDPISLNPLLISYSGGPGSTLGIGKTNIRFADQRTGINNPLAKTNPTYFYSGSVRSIDTLNNSQISQGSILINTNQPWITTGKYEAYNISNSKVKVINYTSSLPLFDVNAPQFIGTALQIRGETSWTPQHSGLNPTSSLINRVSNTYQTLASGSTINNNGTYNYNVYDSGSLKNNQLINNNGTYVYTQNDIISQTPIKGGYGTTQDFRAVLRSKLEQKTPGSKQNATIAGQLTAAPSYNIGNKKTIEERVNLGNPGNRANKNYASYRRGVRNINGASIYPTQDANLLGGKNQGGNTGDDINNKFGSLGLDKINSLPIYKSETVDTSGITNDLCKFRIAVIDNNAPIYKTFVHFRAFLDSINDSYTADWNATKYLGRGENFYNYNGFTRQISLSWTVAAQSKQELIPMYKKLNYLASSLTPEYSPNGYMRGNMVQLTVGGYLYEQPGIITGLTYNIEENTTWEIGINTFGTFDSSVKELPHILRVTGFNFIPIHRFRPELQDNLNDYKHYIALANGEGAQNNNYGSATPEVADTIFSATDPPVNDLRGTGVIAPLLRAEQQSGFIGPLRPNEFQQSLNNLSNLGG